MAGDRPYDARQTAMLRWVALGILIPKAFSVEAALGCFVWCRYSAIQNNVQTDTYDPRRPGATPSLLSCRPNQPISRESSVVFAIVVLSFRYSNLKSILPFGVTFLCESFL